MGLLASPYMAVHFYYWAEEFGRGNRRDLINPLQWDFTSSPTLTHVTKWDSSIENFAGNLVVFIDDLQPQGCISKRLGPFADKSS
jgi:hypothetical protein